MSSIRYQLSGSISAVREASFTIRERTLSFGIADQDDLPNPAELLLGAFAACCLKNVQRFSDLQGFDYTSVNIEATGERQEKPTKMVAIRYLIQISSTDDALNVDLLHRNLQKFGTIYNTLKAVCDVSGALERAV